MKTNAKQFLVFLRTMNIKIFEEDTVLFNQWIKQIHDGHIATIYFDSEEMWVDAHPKHKILFNWDASEFNIHNEYLEKSLGMDPKILAGMEPEMKASLLFDASDFLERMETSYQILKDRYLEFTESNRT